MLTENWKLVLWECKTLHSLSFIPFVFHHWYIASSCCDFNYIVDISTKRHISWDLCRNTILWFVSFLSDLWWMLNSKLILYGIEDCMIEHVVIHIVS